MLPPLTETAVEDLLTAGPVARGRLEWAVRGGHLRSRLPIANDRGESLELDFHISLDVPWKYTLQLMWAKRPIKRLDVRGSHVNHCDGSNTTWRFQTHKQPFKDRYDLGQAYTPGDIPDTNGTVVAPGEYQVSVQLVGGT